MFVLFHCSINFVLFFRESQQAVDALIKFLELEVPKCKFDEQSKNQNDIEALVNTYVNLMFDVLFGKYCGE